MKIEKIFDKIEELYDGKTNGDDKSAHKELKIEIERKIKKTKTEIKKAETSKEKEKLEKKLKVLKKLYKKVD